MYGPTVILVAFLCLAMAVLGGVRAGTAAQICVPIRCSMRGAAPLLLSMASVVFMLTAVVLGMLVTTYKGSFEKGERRLEQFSMRVAEFDRVLRAGGDAAVPARVLLFRYADRRTQALFQATAVAPLAGEDDAWQLRDELLTTVERLARDRPAFAEMAEQARHHVSDLKQASWGLEEVMCHRISPWLSVMLVAWLMLGLSTMGMLAGGNRVGIVSVAGLAVGLTGALFLIAEYSCPFDGVIAISRASIEQMLYFISR